MIILFAGTVLRRNSPKSSESTKSTSAFPSMLLGLPKSQKMEPTTSRPSSFMDFVKKWELQGVQPAPDRETSKMKHTKTIKRVSAASRQPRVVDVGSTSVIRRQERPSLSEERKQVSQSPGGASNVSSFVRAEAAKTGTDALSLEYGYSLVETRKPSFGLLKQQASPSEIADGSASRTQTSQSTRRDDTERPKPRKRWYNKLYFGRQE